MNFSQFLLQHRKNLAVDFDEVFLIETCNAFNTEHHSSGCFSLTAGVTTGHSFLLRGSRISFHRPGGGP